MSSAPARMIVAGLVASSTVLLPAGPASAGESPHGPHKTAGTRQETALGRLQVCNHSAGILDVYADGPSVRKDNLAGSFDECTAWAKVLPGRYDIGFGLHGPGRSAGQLQARCRREEATFYKAFNGEGVLSCAVSPGGSTRVDLFGEGPAPSAVHRDRIGSVARNSVPAVNATTAGRHGTAGVPKPPTVETHRVPVTTKPSPVPSSGPSQPSTSANPTTAAQPSEETPATASGDLDLSAQVPDKNGSSTETAGELTAAGTGHGLPSTGATSTLWLVGGSAAAAVAAGFGSTLMRRRRR